MTLPLDNQDRPLPVDPFIEPYATNEFAGKGFKAWVNYYVQQDHERSATVEISLKTDPTPVIIFTMHEGYIYLITTLPENIKVNYSDQAQADLLEFIAFVQNDILDTFYKG